MDFQIHSRRRSAESFERATARESKYVGMCQDGERGSVGDLKLLKNPMEVNLHGPLS
jgi:hypothetical protein